MRGTSIGGLVVCNVPLLSLFGVLACGSSPAAPSHEAAGTGGVASELGNAGSAEQLAGSGGAPSSNRPRLAWVEPVPAHLQAAAATSARTALRTYVARATADGSVAVGESTLWVYQTATDFIEHSEHFRWTEETGSVSLGALPGVNTSAVMGLLTEVDGMSADGSVLVGVTAGPGGSRVGYRWTSAAGMVELQTPSATTIQDVIGVSADGSVIAGTSLTSKGQRAFRWTEQAGLVVLEPAPGDTNSEATWMSADGTVVIGASAHDAVRQPFRWTAESGVVALGRLPMATSCGPQSLPADFDGRTLFGACGSDAFRWTASSGMVSLGSLSGYDQLVPWGISADGNRITGDARNPAGDYQVFYWSADAGLLGLGFLSGDVQTSSRPFTGMSSDGLTVVGSSSAASGDSVAFRWTMGHEMLPLAPLPGENQSSVVNMSADGSLSAGYSIQHEPGSDATAGPERGHLARGGPARLGGRGARGRCCGPQRDAIEVLLPIERWQRDHRRRCQCQRRSARLRSARAALARSAHANLGGTADTPARAPRVSRTGSSPLGQVRPAKVPFH